MTNDPVLSRRGAVRAAGGAAAVAGAAATVLAGAPTAGAAAAVDYTPGRYRATKVLGVQGRHLVNRFTPGVTPTLRAEVRAAGGARAWFAAQLQNAYDGSADEVADWWPDLHLGPSTIWQRQTTGVRGAWEVMGDYACRTMMRKILSPRPVLEVMTDFWENHLHVPVNGDAQAVWRTSYGEVIRKHALGRFEDMLVEAITHPAMLIFLDGATSTKTHPNENLGRELLELHTVGLGAYTEDDVKASARILTGYSVDVWRTWAASYKTSAHWTGPVRVMDFSDANAAGDGRAVAEAYLRHLARHPRTAQRLARKLAVRFVRDTPSQALVDHLARVYLDNGTAITPVIEALVATREFKASVGAKLRDPVEDVVATYRVIGADIKPPTNENSCANAMLWQTYTLGLAPLSWPRPDGKPATNDPWASPSRALASAGMHWGVAGGWWPTRDVTYRPVAQWVPQTPIVFRDLVDHLSRVVLQRPSTANLLQACCEATETAPTASITPAHAVMKWKWPRLMGTLLDNPTHYKR